MECQSMEFDFEKQPGKQKKYSRIKKWAQNPSGDKAANGEECQAYNGQALMTVITPYYNAGAYFEQTFWSVINQTFPWFEWLIVDDGSDREEDLAVLERFAATDARISVIHRENGGLAAARNTGFLKAGTDIIVPLDADDVLAPQYLEYTYFGLYFHKDAAWCYTDTVGFGQQQYLWKYLWNARKEKKRNYLTATAAIRRQAFEAVGGYRQKECHYYEDWYFWLALLAAHQYPVHVKGYLFWYRRRQDGMLSGIHAHAEAEDASKNIIQRAAKKADGTVRAVEYPVERSREPYAMPQAVKEWDGYQAYTDRKKIRVLLLLPWLVMGGADRFNLDLVSGLDRKRFSCSILTTVPSEHEWQHYFADYTDEIFHLPDFLDPAHYAEYVSFYIRTRGIQVLFVSNSYRGYFMLPYLRKQFPGLCIIDYVHMEEWYWRAGGFARLSGVFSGVLDKTYVCSSAAGKVLVNHFGRAPQSVEVCYIGVDEKRFNPKRVKKGALFQRLGISPKRPVILFPCRICAQKRPFLMLDIAGQVSRRIPEAVFAVVGDGPQRAALEREIKKRGLRKYVYCIGKSAHLEEYYQDASITLICSIREGLSLTAYESCAMGTPVVSSDVGGQSDLIDASCGILVPLRQREAEDFDNRTYDRQEVFLYVKAIEKLLRQKEFYKRCSKNCRKKIEDGFSVHAMLEHMEKELEWLVQDEGLARKRAECCERMRHLGCLAEEIYRVEMAEEERGSGASALMEALERVCARWVPDGSRRREAARAVYQKLINR